MDDVSAKIRLTLRMSEELEKKLRDEAQRKGMNLNQIMLSIINRKAHSLGNDITPDSFS